MLKVAASVLLAATAVSAQVAVYGQCGGNGYTGSKVCASGSTCQYSNDWYSQCLPGAAKPTTTITTVTKAAATTSKRRTTTTTKKAAATTTKRATTSKVAATTTKAATSASAPVSTTKPSTGSASFLGGLNIAGFDFGMTIWGWSGNYQAPPIDQIAHFVNQGANVIRLPFGWQYMEPNGPGTGLSSSFFSLYDSYVQKALSLGAYVALDVHNYARWNSDVVGQSSTVTDANFVALWTALAKKYASNSKVIFGIMNEPHDLTVSTWATTVQKAVNAIRAAGATSQYILIPGSSYTGGRVFISETEPALSKVTDPSGGTDRLIYDVHQYLDSDYSGTSADCTTNAINEFLSPIQAKLKATGRKAFFSEIGGGNTASCETNLKAALAFLASNPAQFLGFTAWSAGSFDPSYTLSLTPDSNGNDRPIWTTAIKPNLPGSSKSKRMLKAHRQLEH